MKNFVQYGESLSLVAPTGGVVGGKGYLIGSLFVVAGQTAAAGSPFTGYRRDVFDLDKVAATAIATGAKVYWDNTAHVVTPTAGTNVLIGVATADAAASDATARVCLTGQV